MYITFNKDISHTGMLSLSLNIRIWKQWGFCKQRFWSETRSNGAYAAVIPKFVMQLMNHETITINGDGNYSRFHLYENVIQMNELAMTTENSAALNTVYNTAFGDRNTLNDLELFERIFSKIRSCNSRCK
jgi:hypothetical protein